MIPPNDVEVESVPIGELWYVRLEHKPTGTLISGSADSEYMAKEIAFEKLVTKLKQIKYEID